MIDDSTVNSQITDSVTQENTTVIGQAVSVTQGMLDTVMAETIGMGLYNAVTAQQGAQMTSNAAVTTACAKMLQAQIPTPPPPAPTPTSVSPLTGPTDNNSVDTKIATANAKAEQAINELVDLEQQSSQSKNSATTDLKALIDKILSGLPYKLSETSLQLLEKKLGKDNADLLNPIVNKEYTDENSFLDALGYSEDVQNTIATSCYSSDTKQYTLNSANYTTIDNALKAETDPSKYAYVLAMLNTAAQKSPPADTTRDAFMQSIANDIELNAILGAAKPDISLTDLLSVISS